jgi:hypothetical protein
MVQAIDKPEREGYLLVTIRYGDPTFPTFSYYTDWTQDTLGFLSTPSMEVDLKGNVGTFDEREVQIALPKGDAFTTAFSGGLTHSPAFARIEEITAGLAAGDAGERRVVFNGRVVRSIKNFEGRSDTVVLFCQNVKSRLKVPMGLACNHHCDFRVFGPGCNAGGLIASAHEKYSELAAIDGNEVTVDAGASSIVTPTSPGGNVDRYWERGYVEKDGLRIDIHIWSLADPTVFSLRRRPPDSWLLAGSTSIRFVPGCHKTIEDCRAVWDNENQAGHFGYGMLPYNPQFESP